MYTPVVTNLSSYGLRRPGSRRGASYSFPARRGMSGLGHVGLGYDVVIGTPLGNQTISIPLEDMSKTMGKQAADAAWTEIKPQIEAEVTKLMSQVTAIVDKTVDQQVNKVLKKVGSSATSLATPAVIGAIGVGAVGLLGYLIYQKKKGRSA